MARHADHHAVVVGLSKYPRLGDVPPSDLRGPEHDARAVRDWLVATDGGGLSDENVHLILSSQFPTSADGAPDRDEIQDVLVKLAETAERERPGIGSYGQRLYVYASGHGFSPSLNEGCLHAADAGGLRTQTNVYFTKWLQMFQEGGFFRETVLWMDCCMDRDRSDPSLPTFAPRSSPLPPGPTFVAFAARRPMKAIERPTGPAGEFHGIFTTVLLEGLQGAAGNRYGMVTGRSLADWLRNAQLHRIDGDDLTDPRVSKEPEILREDQELVFARGRTPVTYEIKLTFPTPPPSGQVRLWSGRPPVSRPLALTGVGELVARLVPGMYIIDAPGTDLRHGFDVTAHAEIVCDGTGGPVTPPVGLVEWTLDAGDPTGELFVVDEEFGLVDRGVGRMDLQLPFGIYKVRLRSGRRLADRVHMLDRPAAARSIADDLPRFTSAAPIGSTARTHEYHESAAANALARRDLTAGNGGSILLMARQWRSDDVPPSTFRPWEGVRLTNSAGETMADMTVEGERHNDRDPCATLSLDVDPGIYFLRVALPNGRELERSLVVSAGWCTEAHLLRAPQDSDSRDEQALRYSVFIKRPYDPLQASDLLVEKARVALADERLVLKGELDDMLIAKFENPLAGVLGAHLLIVENERRPGSRIGKLDEIVSNLRGLVGKEHPDVEALSLLCRDPKLRMRGRLTGPPMLFASWRLAVQASYRGRHCVDEELWTRVHALSPEPPFMVWWNDERSRRESVKSTLANLGLGEDGGIPVVLGDVETGNGPVSAAATAEPQAIPAGLPKSAGARSRVLVERSRQLGLPRTAIDLVKRL